LTDACQPLRIIAGANVRGKTRITQEGAVGKLGLPEIILLVGIALLLFGPSKFASLGKGLGEGLRNFKSAMKEGEEGTKKNDEPKS